MYFGRFADYLEKIEGTPSRIEMTNILAEMLGSLSDNEVRPAMYLSTGNLGANYDPTEFGISDKLMIRVIAETFGQTNESVSQEFKTQGDLGLVAAKFKENFSSQRLEENLTVGVIYDRLYKIALMGGTGSQEEKVKAMGELMKELNALAVKYLVRITLKKLRLGFSDMTILDALSQLIAGDKSVRKEIEEKFNLLADIGQIAEIVKQGGVDSLAEVTMTIGVPVRPAAADRLPGSAEIIEKLGEVLVEPKLDGFRLQVHYSKNSNQVVLFSRNLENMTEMFPEIIEGVKLLDIESAIIEGEAVGFNPTTGDFLPFQETIQRRRKYDIEEKAVTIPLKLFVFDVLYLNGRSMLDEPLTKRRQELTTFLSKKDKASTIQLIDQKKISQAEKLSEYFAFNIEHGLEGIVAKRPNGIYTAGKRNSNWVKLKRENKGELNDSVDCVVMGYKAGTGKRSGFGIGAFLVGVYNQDQDRFETISNVGTGLTDDQWQEMRQRCEQIKVKDKPVRYEVPKELAQDVWCDPKMVVEILADEITRSPLHTAGKKETAPGYALRFPRLISWRDDKGAEQATSVKEINNLYEIQSK